MMIYYITRKIRKFTL